MRNRKIRPEVVMRLAEEIPKKTQAQTGTQGVFGYVSEEKERVPSTEAASYIHRHASTLDKWRAQKISLPFYKDGKKVLYCVDDLDAYLASKRVEPIAYGID